MGERTSDSLHWEGTPKTYEQCKKSLESGISEHAHQLKKTDLSQNEKNELNGHK